MSNKRPVVSKLFAPIHGDEPLFTQSLSLGSSDPDHDTLAIVDFAATTKNEAPVTHDTSVKTALSDIYVFAISDFPFRDDDAGGHLSAARTPERMIPIIHTAQARVAARRRLLVSMLC